MRSLFFSFLNLTNIKIMQKTKAEILKETIEFYGADPINRRSVVRNEAGTILGCLYNGPNGTHCAVGRCLKPEILQKIGFDTTTSSNNKSIVNDLISNYGEDIFKKEYSGHEIYFWYYIQSLHDSDINWNTKGLTETGKTKVQGICKVLNN
jgi:hypothetical protein